MTTAIREGDWVFEFAPPWQVLKYDAPDGFHCTCLQQSQGGKAVDVVGTTGGELLLLEIKDFRGHAQAGQPRLNPADAPEVAECRDACRGKPVKIARAKPFLGDEVVEKVKGTLFGLLAAGYWQRAELSVYREILTACLPVRVVLFLCQDEELEQKPDYPRLLGRLQDRMRRDLNFPGIKVLVVSRERLPPSLCRCIPFTSSAIEE